jgi:mono/diheme cytochrome c family protein
MSRIGKALRTFFAPPPGTRLWRRLLPYATLLVVVPLGFYGVAYAWEYTNSPEFCGTTCHTMPPEYTAYLTSPHARVACVECHIGRDFITTRITRKAGDIKHILATVFKAYEFPIRATDLRPARETCERCHSPQKFSNDSLVEIKHFASDVNNTPTSTYLILKTGGGSKRQGLGRGIHWHIESKVFYLPQDDSEQAIPYVRVVNDDGTVTEYVDTESNIDRSKIDPSKLKEMDCITCHNRVTHLILPPDAAADQLLTRKLLPVTMPEIRRKAVEVLGARYDTTQAASDTIAGLRDFYRTTYPDYYAANAAQVDAAISTLQETYRNSTFPEQKADWTTHANNVGHRLTAGCFRCHDGKHLDDKQQAIRLECNLCHSIPVVAGPDQFVSRIEISRGPEPQTHLNANWLGLHRDAFDSTCANCHTTTNPGGTDNSSFCSNSGCHGNKWEFAGLDAPSLREILKQQLPPKPTPVPTTGALTYNDTIGPLFNQRCSACHGQNATQGLNLTTYQTALAGSKNGPVIVPGQPDASLLVKKQSADQPHFGQLAPEELKLVKDWIAAGAPEK